MNTARFGVSMDGELLERLDRLVKRKRYPNRSEAIRDLVRGALVEEEWDSPKDNAIGVAPSAQRARARGRDRDDAPPSPRPR
jgi:metal-responsive CopG/Arc/MetJ family transcriptional regulator